MEKNMHDQGFKKSIGFFTRRDENTERDLSEKKMTLNAQWSKRGKKSRMQKYQSLMIRQDIFQVIISSENILNFWEEHSNLDS